MMWSLGEGWKGRVVYLCAILAPVVGGVLSFLLENHPPYSVTSTNQNHGAHWQRGIYDPDEQPIKCAVSSTPCGSIILLTATSFNLRMLQHTPVSRARANQALLWLGSTSNTTGSKSPSATSCTRTSRSPKTQRSRI
jgi:hypothetical protein